MKSQKLLFIIPVFLFATIIFASNMSKSEAEKTSESKEEITDESDNNENFDKMMAVLMHPRCMNCHPSDNIPKQGEDSHPHYFGMARGQDNHGFEATNCNTCHQHENNDYSGVPGAPEWSLAPHSMRWEGLSRVEIATSMLDPKRNGGRDHKDLIKHLTEHELVLWAWEPGIDAAGNHREAPPVPVDEYIEAVEGWFEAGAEIPEK